MRRAKISKIEHLSAAQEGLRAAQKELKKKRVHPCYLRAAQHLPKRGAGTKKSPVCSSNLAEHHLLPFKPLSPPKPHPLTTNKFRPPSLQNHQQHHHHLFPSSKTQQQLQNHLFSHHNNLKFISNFLHTINQQHTKTHLHHH
jgi:hypothetical protein